MNLTVSGKNLQITPGLRSYMEKKMDRVKYFFPHLIDVHVVMEVEKKITHKVEITIKSDGKTIHSEYKTQDMYQAIDGLIDRVERQIRRYKEKLKDFHFAKIAQELKKQETSFSDFSFTKIREVMPKPMSDEEAILQLDAQQLKFYIYKTTPMMSEEDYKNLSSKNDTPLRKTVLVKEEDHFVVIRKVNGKWEEESVKLENEKINLIKKEDSRHVEEKGIEEAVRHLVEENIPYYIFYDDYSELLSIVYKRKNNTLGLITSNPQN